MHYAHLIHTLSPTQALPVYIWDIGGEEGNFYGFPEQPEYPGQVKVAFHMVDDVRYVWWCC